MSNNVLIVGAGATPYVAPREQSPSFVAPFCKAALRRQSAPGSCWRPLQVAQRARPRIVSKAVAIRNLEVGRAMSRPGGAMLPRLGPGSGRSAGR